MDKLQYIGFLGIPIMILSLIGLAIIFERIIFYLKLPPVDKCRVFHEIKHILEENSRQPKSIRDELATFLLTQAKKPYDFGIKILRVIAVVSPMLGLLGTVLGIIESFKKIATHEGPVYPALIAEGLWTAMLTTAAGLIVALPCLFAAFIFARMRETRISAYETELNRLSLKLEGVKI
ncbi:MAG: MotA/TolQ/ExbB proton channel family protein [Rickettsiales bacterium]|nr:MotA/TolQ/ExbB proton channel family protein [Pseudomonadota bacterium]MDA0966241.1 MotA/TolQ/ExbB proton channel family protein [Pseudomonadota bacterium]MDG4543094.1 MotA/TolQ/ExbB proton channel family protein [Rickettsiales bacterium]MDG4545292.1 MotA/TolQ/ExbB proton channel family protein [Rickettsiales bacterium]MDG4547741.1 MotA/TolQ/ExbB proton channel family protein [Rickettsiales bacterium]